jgi:hypothetical protein
MALQVYPQLKGRKAIAMASAALKAAPAADATLPTFTLFSLLLSLGTKPPDIVQPSP